jgi:predicted MFS family arabinose efflux permease
LAVALVSFAALAAAFSLRASLGLVIPIWQHDFGWSRSFISAVGALALIVAGLTALCAGIAVDRFGARAVLLSGLAIAAVGACLVAGANGGAGVVIGYGLVSAVSFGLVGNHVVATGIARLTKEARGLAISIAVAGSTAGQLALMPLLALVVAMFGWRASFLVCAALAVTLLPILAWTMGGGGVAKAPSCEGVALPPRRLWEEVSDLLASPTFQVLFWSYLLCGYTTTGVIETHFLPFTAVCGFAPLPSATAFGVLSLCKLFGMLAFGWLSDRVSRPLLLGTVYSLRGLTFLVLLNLGSSYEWLLIFAVLFGLFDYATVPITASLVVSHFGIRRMGLAMGIISAGHALGAAAGAYSGGMIFDELGGYDWLWRVSIVAAVGAGLAVWTLRDKPRQGDVVLA